MWMEGRSKVLRQFRLPLRILENRRLRGCQVKLQIYDLHPTIDLRFRSAGDSLDPLDSYRSSSSTINLSTVDVVLVAKLCEGISCPLTKGAGALPHYLARPPFALLASATIQKDPSCSLSTSRRGYFHALGWPRGRLLLGNPFSSWAKKRTAKKKMVGSLTRSDSPWSIVAPEGKGAGRGNG
jgi:hypothetical protein